MLRLFAAGLLLCSAAFAQTKAQSALTLALKGTPAVGLVIDVKTGRPLAEVKASAAATIRATPGSILKPLFLTLALQQHEVLPTTAVFCRRTLQIRDGNRQWNLNCTHPQTGAPFTAQQALAYSCNRYFVQLADRIPPAQAATTLQHYGLPSPNPPPTPEKKELLVLGLAGIAVSPAQIAFAYRKLAQEWTPPVRDGLRDSVTYGMAHNAAVDGRQIFGKTGTADDPAQGWSHGWFAGIANFGREQLVLVIYLPRGNGADAASLAKHFFLAAAEK